MNIDNTNFISLDLSTGRVVQSKIPSTILNPDEIGVTTKEILVQLSEAKKVAVLFNKVTDGSAYSLAAKIRENTRGVELHAIGSINQEFSYFLKRSGFDIAHFNCTPNRPLKILNHEESLSVLNPFKKHYQNGEDGSEGLF